MNAPTIAEPTLPRGSLTAGAAAIVGATLHDLVEFGRPSEQNTAPVAVLVCSLLVAW